MEISVMEINKSLVPYDFNIILGAEEFNLRVDYNNTGRFFTIELTKDGETLCSGDPIMYGRKLFKDVRNAKFPSIDIIPCDLAKEHNAVTYDNLCETVLLVVDDQEEPLVENDY